MKKQRLTKKDGGRDVSRQSHCGKRGRNTEATREGRFEEVENLGTVFISTEKPKRPKYGGHERRLERPKYGGHKKKTREAEIQRQ